MACHAPENWTKTYRILYSIVPQDRPCPAPIANNVIDSAMGRLLSDGKAYCSGGTGCPDGEVCAPVFSQVRATLGQRFSDITASGQKECRVAVTVTTRVHCECMDELDIPFPEVGALPALFKPGKGVTGDRDYAQQPQEKREYWEGGQNGTLSETQQHKLNEEAENAGRYDRGTRGYTDDYPRNPDGSVDHGALVRNVKQYVDDKLEPDRDIFGTPSPRRDLGPMIDSSGTPGEPKPPPDNPTNNPRLPGWVCINHAAYAAALLRALGYPVREVSVKLTQTTAFSGGDTYQEGAIQVWFDGKWHYVDPYLCIYDPAEIVGAYSDWTDFHTYVWDGTTPPTDWRPPNNDGGPGGWRKISDKEAGADLQRRFYPRQQGTYLPPRRIPEYAMTYPRWVTDPIATLTERAEGSRSGVWIFTRTSGAKLYLIDSHGERTDGIVKQIPGAAHIRGGSPIGWVKEQPAAPLEQAPRQQGLPREEVYPEAVFFGTVRVQAVYSEIATHKLSLGVIAAPNTTVVLECNVAAGLYPVRVSSLPARVRVRNRPLLVPIQVTIMPADPTFHATLSLLIRKGLATEQDYWFAQDEWFALKADAKSIASMSPGPLSPPESPE